MYSLDTLKVVFIYLFILFITLILSKLDYASVDRSNLTLADSNKMENIKTEFANLCFNRFIQPNSFCNYESMLNYSHFKKLHSRGQNLVALFLIRLSTRRVTTADNI
jgi:hypothetical protein